MTTRIWSFLPVDMNHVPEATAIENAVHWLREAMPAYKVEAIDHGKIAFFDCGGNMGATYCPHCRTEMSAPVLSDWMTDDYDAAKGFTFSIRAMPCCGSQARLDDIAFENTCMFGRFAIQVTDTLKTYSEKEILGFEERLVNHLGCPLRHLEAHY
jgi:thiol-disulfide isomerase/thioredoxin